MKEKEIIIITDGASSGNPGPGGWGAIVSNDVEIFEIGGREEKTTNNRMEMVGVISALKISQERFPEIKKIKIFTDSKYLINGASSWIFAWQRNGWKTKEKKDVLNKDLWEEILSFSGGKKIEWTYVKGHYGVILNERVDQIAVAFSQKEKIDLFRGKIEKYPLKDALEKPQKRGVSLVVETPYYISLIGGKLKKYKLWRDCEKDVRGQENVRFKKVKNEMEEKETLERWANNDRS